MAGFKILSGNTGSWTRKRIRGDVTWLLECIECKITSSTMLCRRLLFITDLFGKNSIIIRYYWISILETTKEKIWQKIKSNHFFSYFLSTQALWRDIFKIFKSQLSRHSIILSQQVVPQIPNLFFQAYFRHPPPPPDSVSSLIAPLFSQLETSHSSWVLMFPESPQSIYQQVLFLLSENCFWICSFSFLLLTITAV